ncbi:MAG TPA: hypothetical protein VER76_21785 [Pyrinomonadaceae bacterium]|nr:hypothetical protein [Pyrinomonadaceae bacterium]
MAEALTFKLKYCIEQSKLKRDLTGAVVFRALTGGKKRKTFIVCAIRRAKEAAGRRVFYRI